VNSRGRKASPRLTTQVEAVLSVLDTLPFEWPGDEAYGLIRTQLEMAGTPVGGNDMLIAAQAVALDYTLVTDNESDYLWSSWRVIPIGASALIFGSTAHLKRFGKYSPPPAIIPRGIR